jgi:acyl-coenzyme A synthetase/AMP-(fatty) acid ligase
MADDLLDLVGALWNVYGPTETTVWSMCSRIIKDGATITVGQPINNMQVYILDRYQTPVPIGVIGELHIAGEGLSRGYLNQPDLTQKQFFFNSLTPTTPEARLYKTGDLARFLPNYEIEILGRKDDQVKVQGNRIELGEINATLSQHPAIDKSIVLSFMESPQTKGLVAYYIPLVGFSPAAETLRSFLRRKLPTYMIPAYFVQLEAFPILTSGKINRKALPPPKAIRSHAGYASPTNEDEQVMTRLWLSVLGLEKIGIHDNFFELGGASIQSIQIVAKATMYGYPISIDNIFEFQTIEKLMAQLKPRS